MKTHGFDLHVCNTSYWSIDYNTHPTQDTTAVPSFIDYFSNAIYTDIGPNLSGSCDFFVFCKETRISSMKNHENQTLICIE